MVCIYGVAINKAIKRLYVDTNTKYEGPLTCSLVHQEQQTPSALENGNFGWDNEGTDF